jgi:PucR-like helix-turn-helix protein
LNKQTAPWEAVPPEAAAALRPAIPALVEEIITAVQTAVPAYEGGLDRNVRTGVKQAMEGFLELIEGGDDAHLPGSDVYYAFGRGEARNGRSLESLLTAYRAGAQVAWRGFARAGDEAGVEPQVLYTLAEGIFAFIDEISAVTAEGYTFEQSLTQRERHEQGRRLLEALLSDPQPPPEEIHELAEDAEWALPDKLAALVFDGAHPDRVGARLPEDSLFARLDGLGWALLPDPDAPRRRREVEAALHGSPAAIGPTRPWAEAPESAVQARLALDAVARDRPGELVAAGDHLLELMIHRGGELADDLARRRLAPLDELPPSTRERLIETLAAWLDAQGEVRPAAERLHVHVQTVRYRLGRLRDALGDALDDPRARLELALALRVRAGSG